MGAKYVYGLRQVGDWEFRYIGQTSDPVNRLKGHRSDYHKYSHGRCSWMQEVINGGSDVELVVLTEVNESAADYAESKTIAFYRNMGHRLTNERRPRIPKQARLDMMKTLLAERPDDVF